MVQLRFTRPWRNYRTGQLADIPGGAAAELVARHYAVRDTQQQLLETATLEPVVERADATPRRRRKQ